MTEPTESPHPILTIEEPYAEDTNDRILDAIADSPTGKVRVQMLTFNQDLSTMDLLALNDDGVLVVVPE